MNHKTLQGILRIAVCAVLCVAQPAQAQQMGIAAVVNDEMISTLDVQARMALAVATTGMSSTPEDIARIQPQIIRQLIDERLQIQEANRLGITVSEDEIAGGFANVNQQRGLPAGTFQRFLQENGVPLDTVKTQIEAQLAWTKVVAQSLRRRVNVGEDEVQRAREQAGKGQKLTEVKLSSILLEIDKPENEPQVRALAEKLAEDIRNGANFGALARQFSAGSAEMIEQFQNRWVQPHQLEPILARVISNMQINSVSPPVRTLSGYHLMKLHDKRTVNTAKVLDSEVLLKQITMNLKNDAEQQEAEVLLDIARNVAKAPGACHENQVAGVSGLGEFNFDVNFLRANFREIQPNLQGMLASLRVGDVSEPFATPEGIHIIQLCERIEMPRQLPSADQVREKLFRDKVELEATKRMRELRREALVEVRG